MLKSEIYTVGGTVQIGRGYYLERQADQDLLELCRAGEFAYILSARQVGKSSLMVKTAEKLLAEDIQSVKLDLTMIGTQVEPESWYFGLLFEIKKQLRLKLDITGWWQQHAGLGLTQRLTLFFEDVLLDHLAGSLVIFVDEIDTTLSLSFTDDFFAAIRALYTNRARNPDLSRVSFVLIGVATPGDLVRDPKRTPFNIGERVEMTDFSLEEALPLAAGLNLPPETARQVLRWVLEWTGGHPYLTQRLCQALITFDSKNETRGIAQVSPAWVASIVHSTFFEEQSERDNNLQFVRDMLTKRAPDMVGVLSTYREIRRARRPIPDEEQSLVKNHLKLSGIVQRQAAGLKMRNLIYRTVFDERWIKQHLPINWAKRLRQASRLIAVMALVTLLMTALTIYALVQREEATTQRNMAQAQAVTAQAAQQEALKAQQTAEARRIEAEQQRQLALSRELAANAISQSSSDPELGLLLAVQAEKTAHTAQSEATLRQLLIASPLRKTWRIGGSAGLFSRDGARLAFSDTSSGNVRQVQIMDLTTGRVVQSLPPNQGNYKPLAWSRDNERLLIISEDGKKATLWKVAPNSVQLIGDLNPGISVTMAVFSSTGAKLAMGSPDGTIQVWETISGKPTIQLKHDGTLLSLDFSPDEAELVSAGQDGNARLWELQAGKLLAVLDKHSSTVSSATFSPDGQRVVTASYDGTIRLWDTSTGQEQGTLAGHTDRVYGAVFSPDGERVISYSRDQTIKVWDAISNKLVADLNGNRADITGMVVSPDGRLVASSGADKVVRVWNIAKIPATKLFELNTAQPVAKLIFSSDSQRLISIDQDQTVFVSDTILPPAVRSLEGHTDQVNSAVFSPDGLYLVSAGVDGVIRLWETATGRFVSKLDRDCGCPLNDLEFSPDGKMLVAATADGNVERWEVKDGKFNKLNALPTNGSAVLNLSFSRDGKRLIVVLPEKIIKVMDAQNGAFLTTFPQIGGQAASAVFSADGSQIIFAGEDGTIRIWSMASGQLVNSWSGQRGAINQIALSPDGTKLAMAGANGMARLWEFRSGKLLADFKGHQGSVTNVTFDPTGSLVITTGADGTTRIWQSSGQEISQLKDHTGRVTSANVSPDGTQLVTTGADRLVKLYRQETFVPVANLLELAQVRVSRELSCDEQKEYLHLIQCN